jgi:hypothetical protein
MKEFSSIKSQCLIILDYFIKIKIGGETCISIWNWEKQVVAGIDEKRGLGKKQMQCMYSDTLEGIADFNGEQLTELMILGIENGVNLNLGKMRSKRIIKFFLKEKEIKNSQEYQVVERLYSFYGEDFKLSIDEKNEIESLLKDNKWEESPKY